MNTRNIAYCSIFGAAALLLPTIFHLFHLGHVFMPMYLPLVTLGFIVGPLPASITAFIIPLMSGFIVGMPPFYPPIAPIMSIELALMSASIAIVRTIFPKQHVLVLLLPILLLGRIVHVGLIYGAALLMKLPPKFVAGASLLSGWPGVILMIVTIPGTVYLYRQYRLGQENVDGT